MQKLSDVDVVPAQIGCRQNPALVQINRPGTPDPDPPNPLAIQIVFIDQTFDRRSDPGDPAIAAVATSRFSAAAAQRIPPVVVGDRQHFGAAKVKSDPDVV